MGIAKYSYGYIVNTFFYRVPRYILAATGAFGLVCVSKADFVYLKDGYILEGKVKRDHQIELDPLTKEAIVFPKGFFQVDDGARRIYFLPSHAQIAEKDLPIKEEKFTYPKTLFIPHGRPMPSIWEVIQTDEWDRQWDRSFIFKGPTGLVGMKQHLGTITPKWARADAINRHRWGCMYLTREFTDECLRNLLDSNPSTMNKSDLSDAERLVRLKKRFDFWLQADREMEAFREVKAVEALGLAQKDAFTSAQKSLLIFSSEKKAELAKRLLKSGQTDFARKSLDSIRLDFASERAIDGRGLVLTEVDALVERNTRIKKMLQKIQGALVQRASLAEALADILNEYHDDGFNRMEEFLAQAELWERSGSISNQILISKIASLAVSGWIMGKTGVEEGDRRAASLWHLRKIMLTYLKCQTKAIRKTIWTNQLNDLIQKQAEDAALMVQYLPPFRLDKKPLNGEPIEIFPLQDASTRFGFHVQLPPGYHPGRRWAMLVVLHGSGEQPVEHIAKWSKLAAEEGYILLAPHWEVGGHKTGYSYSPREHAVVLNSIREARDLYRVDDDRIFLFGQDGGGNAAFDIGLSHPDIFAGVIPMSGGAFYFSSTYWRNAQQTPFYVVNGDYAGDLNIKNREIFTSWASRSFPMIWCQYKGRGIEWFAGEMEHIFAWMRPKRRYFSLTALGNGGGQGILGNEYRSLRATDNHFYWLGFGEISKNFQITGDKWNSGIQPATVSAWVDKLANRINIRSTGCLEVVVRLCRNSRGEGVVRLDAPVVILHKLTTVLQQKVEIDLEDLLEDLVARGDREILVLKEIRFKP